MNTKLTLSINQEIMQKAKEYATLHNVSLSSIVENYFLKIISENTESDTTIHTNSTKESVIDSLSGIIALENNKNYQEEHLEYLTKKYV